MKTKVIFAVGLLTGMLIILVMIFVSNSMRSKHIEPALDFASNIDTLRRPPLPADPFQLSYGSTDYQWEIQQPGEEAISLEEFKGNVLFVNLWATWCGPCLQEFPEIEGLMERFEQDQDVAFLLVTDESVGLVEDFLNEPGFGLEFNTLPFYSSQERRPPILSSLTYPTTYIFDKSGELRYRYTGLVQWNTEPVETFIRSLQANPVQG